MDFLDNMFGGIFGGVRENNASRIYAVVAMALGLIAPTVKNLDSDNAGLDDLIADFATNLAKFFGRIKNGDFDKLEALADVLKQGVDDVIDYIKENGVHVRVDNLDSDEII